MTQHNYKIRQLKDQTPMNNTLRHITGKLTDMT